MATDSKRTVFISWSGVRSKYVASALRLWLPNVIQVLDSWMSEQDLPVGSRWSAEIARRLGEANFGIICVNPENQLAPWLQFEAGALGKVLERSSVCPYLIDLDPPDLQFPLAMFQAASANKSGTGRLVEAINDSLGDQRLTKDQLVDTFELWWPRLEAELSSAPQPDSVPPPKSEREMLNELVTLVRHLVTERSPEDRISEFLGVMRGLFQGLQGLGAPPLPPQLEDSLRASMTEALKPGAEKLRELLQRDPKG